MTIKYKDTFGWLYDVLKNLEGDKLDIFLTSIENSLTSINVDGEAIAEIMYELYSNLLTDAINRNQTDKLKYFLDKFYSRNSNDNYLYNISNFYINIFYNHFKTDKMLPLVKFLIKQQIKNLKEHDDCYVEYDPETHPNFVKYLYNIGYIPSRFADFYKRFNWSKLNI